jgi:hypothetical protein
MGGVAEHVDEHELGHVPVPELRLILADGRAYRRAFPPHHRALLRRRLARAYRAYHLPAGSSRSTITALARGCTTDPAQVWGIWGSHRRLVPEEKGLMAMSEAKSSTIFSTVSMLRSRGGHAAARGELAGSESRGGWGREAAEGGACRARWANRAADLTTGTGGDGGRSDYAL